MTLFQLYHTLRPLRASQITGRLRKHARAIIEDPAGFARRSQPSGGACRWSPRADFLPPGPQRNRVPDLKQGSRSRMDALRHYEEILALAGLDDVELKRRMRWARRYARGEMLAQWLAPKVNRAGGRGPLAWLDRLLRRGI